MPEQRMVSMKMFLVSIGLLLVLNIGIGATLYLELEDSEDTRFAMDRALYQTIEAKEDNLVSEISDLEHDLFILQNAVDDIEHEVCEPGLYGCRGWGDTVLDRLESAEGRIRFALDTLYECGMIDAVQGRRKFGDC